MPSRRNAAAADSLAAEVAAHPSVQRALAWAAHNAAALIDETARISEIPAPTFAEGDRAAYVANRFHELGLDAIEGDSAGNVYGLLPGEGRAAVALAAHMDTVFPGDISHAVTRKEGRLFAPGVGDNSAGLAGMIGAAAALQAAGVRPRRPLWLVATTGEEGLGNLCGATAATDRLGSSVDAMIAVEGSFLGRLSYSAVGSRRVEITATAPGGHSWHDFGKPSAVHALARIAAAITDLTVPAEPRTTFNIGRIEGGTGVNVIAERASMLVDMRSVDARALDDLTARLKAVVKGATLHGVGADVREVGFRPAGEIAADHPLVRLCTAVLNHLGMTPQTAPASTDANIPLSRGIPAVTLGITRGGGAHTRGEWIDAAPIVKGVQQLVLVTLALAGVDSSPSHPSE